MTKSVVVLGLAVALCGASLEARGQETTKKRQEPGMNKQFESPDLDVESFVKRFEGESREVSARRGEIVKAVEVAAGQAVADIGAGTGLFTREFAKTVGAEGRVYAVDISPAFLKHIAAEAKKAGQEKVIETVLGEQKGTNLAAGTVDVVFICDTYHHFDDPKAMLGSIRTALKPGGRLYVIDFDRDGDASELVKNHVRAPKEVFFREIEEAGFAKFEPAAAAALKLEENFFSAFRKVEQAEGGTAPGAPR